MSGYLQKKVILLLLVCCVATCAIAQKNESISTRDRRSATVVAGLVFQIGGFAIKAVRLFHQLAVKNRAKALIFVTNYLDQPLTQCEVSERWGVTKSNTPITIHSGVEEGFAVQQNKAARGVEMTWSCHVTSSTGKLTRWLVYFQIEQKYWYRKPNRLSIANAQDSDDHDYYTAMSTGIYFHGPVQCNTSDFVVQAAMSTSHHAQIDIVVYPKSTENLASYTKGKGMGQETLNAILMPRSSCSSHSSLS